MFERTMIDIALKHTAGRRRDAANLLGWGRNTLTRKIKELGEDDEKKIDSAESTGNEVAGAKAKSPASDEPDTTH